MNPTSDPPAPAQFRALKLESRSALQTVLRQAPGRHSGLWADPFLRKTLRLRAAAGARATHCRRRRLALPPGCLCSSAGPHRTRHGPNMGLGRLIFVWTVLSGGAGFLWSAMQQEPAAAVDGSSLRSGGGARTGPTLKPLAAKPAYCKPDLPGCIPNDINYVFMLSLPEVRPGCGDAAQQACSAGASPSPHARRRVGAPAARLGTRPLLVWGPRGAAAHAAQGTSCWRHNPRRPPPCCRGHPSQSSCGLQGRQAQGRGVCRGSGGCHGVGPSRGLQMETLAVRLGP